MAVDRDTALVGADGVNDRQGAVYIFERNGTIWSQQAQVVASDRGLHDYFGQTVALDGNTILVGAPAKDIDANIHQGAAFVFSLTEFIPTSTSTD